MTSAFGGRSSAYVVRAAQAIIGVVIGAAGFGLGLAPPPEVEPGYIAGVSSLLALVALWLAALRAAAMSVERYRERWRRISATALVLAVAGCVSYPLIRERYTYYSPPDDTRYVRGREFTQNALEHLARIGPMTSFELVKDFGGPANRGEVWTDASLTRAKLLLGATFSMMILVLCVVLFALVEAHLAPGAYISGKSTRFMARPPPAEASQAIVRLAQKEKENTFDVLVCFNSRDRTAVTQIARELNERGIRPWLSEWELIPGRRWIGRLEDQIETVPAAAVFVGDSGIGPWQSVEIEALLHRLVERHLPVIPVLLPGATEKPPVPLFLRAVVWVDLRHDRQEGMERLLWGITGDSSVVRSKSQR
jgi:hypothetical protein